MVDVAVEVVVRARLGSRPGFDHADRGRRARLPQPAGEDRDGGCESRPRIRLERPASRWRTPRLPADCQTGKRTREEHHRRNLVGGGSRDRTSRPLACYARRLPYSDEIDIFGQDALDLFRTESYDPEIAGAAAASGGGWGCWGVMRVIGRLLVALAVAFPVTVALAAGADGATGPASQHCGHWEDSMRITPGVGMTSREPVGHRAREDLGLHQRRGGAQYSSTMRMSNATCDNLAMSGTASFDWADGSHSTAWLSFQSQAVEPNKVEVNGSDHIGDIPGPRCESVAAVHPDLQRHRCQVLADEPAAPHRVHQHPELPALDAQHDDHDAGAPQHAPPARNDTADSSAHGAGHQLRRYDRAATFAPPVTVATRAAVAQESSRSNSPGTLAFTGSSAPLGSDVRLRGPVDRWRAGVRLDPERRRRRLAAVCKPPTPSEVVPAGDTARRCTEVDAGLLASTPEMPPTPVLLAHVVQRLQRRRITHRLGANERRDRSTMSPRAAGSGSPCMPSASIAAGQRLQGEIGAIERCARSSAITRQRSASARRSASSAAATASASSARSRPNRSERTSSSTVGAAGSGSEVAGAFENGGCMSVGWRPACSRSLQREFSRWSAPGHRGPALERVRKGPGVELAANGSRAQATRSRGLTHDECGSDRLIDRGHLFSLSTSATVVLRSIQTSASPATQCSSTIFRSS